MQGRQSRFLERLVGFGLMDRDDERESYLGWLTGGNPPWSPSSMIGLMGGEVHRSRVGRMRVKLRSMIFKKACLVERRSKANLSVVGSCYFHCQVGRRLQY